MNSKILFVTGILPFIFSCERVYISTPQPVDSKNIYSFPEKYRGVWAGEENTVMIIEKDIFRYIQKNDTKVPKHEIDSSSYILKDHHIYVIDKEERELSKGFPYKIINDTVVFQEQEVYEIELGNNAFLKKVKKNHILNTKQENQWWELILLNKDTNGNIIVCLLDIKDLNKFTNYEHIHSFKPEYDRYDYIEANWTKKELLEMLDQGMFSDTLFILDVNNRILTQ